MIDSNGISRDGADHCKSFQNNLKVANFNARSIPGHITDIQFLILNNNFDIVIVSETWLFHGAPPNLCDVDGYTLFRSDRLNRRGGGVGVYVKSIFDVEVLNIKCDNSGVEQLWLSISVNSVKVAVGSLYRPSYISYSELNSLTSPIEYCTLNFNHLVIGGDLNIDYLKQNLPECLFFKSVIAPFDIKQIIVEPTRITKTSASLIDYICVFNNSPVSNIKQYPISFSDHNCIEFEYCIAARKPRPTPITRRSFKHFNADQFSQDISAANWEVVYSGTDIDVKVNIFNNIIIQLFDKHAPR